MQIKDIPQSIHLLLGNLFEPYDPSDLFDFLKRAAKVRGLIQKTE